MTEPKTESSVPQPVDKPVTPWIAPRIVVVPITDSEGGVAPGPDGFTHS